MIEFKFQRLKIIEQIAIVFFIAVVIPMSISGFVINNINQQSVRHQLRESAMLIADMVSDEVDFFIKTNETTLSQIADTLAYLPSQAQKKAFLSGVSEKYPHCKKITIVKTQDEADKLKLEAITGEETAMYTKMKNGLYMVALLSTKNYETKLFESLRDDGRQIYILDGKGRLIASHNFTQDVYDGTMEMLSRLDNKNSDTPVIFGDEKNEPIVYLNNNEFDYSVIVRTTRSIAKKAIIDNRVKIILSVLIAISSTMVLIGFYILYLYINIRQLFKAIMALSKGNYEHRIRLLKTSFTPYELVFLTNEFNELASEIHKAYLELKQKNIELKELNEFRSNLIDTVSHELRTPLTSIIGYTGRLMRQDIVLDEDIKQKAFRYCGRLSVEIQTQAKNIFV